MAKQCELHCLIAYCFVRMGTCHGMCKGAMALKCSVRHQQTECFVIKIFIFIIFIVTLKRSVLLENDK
jgi:hypothetical protein